MMFSAYNDDERSLGVTYSELLKRVEKKANYISKECPQFDTLFGKDTQSWSNGGVDSQLLVIVPWDESKETFESVEKSYLIRSTTVLWYTNLMLSEREKGTWDEKKRDVFRDADVVF